LTVTVLIAFDQPLVAAGVGAVLDAEPDITVVARTGSRTVLDAASAYQPDVVVMDVSPEESDAIGKVIASGARRVLVLTAHRTSRLVCDAVLAGASGYLSTATSPEAIPEAVRAVTGVGVWLDPAVAADLVADLARQPVAGPVNRTVLARLTRRETEVLVLLAEGLSNDEIARRLVISALTVRTHVRRTLAKLHARNRAHAVTEAYRLGLVRIPPAR